MARLHHNGEPAPAAGGGVPGARAFATVHPSYLLRLRDPDEHADAYALFVAELGRLVEPA